MDCYYGLQITILPTNHMFSFCILRRIAIPASEFDEKVKFLEETRECFGTGTFNISEDVLLRSYYSFVKDEYNEGKPRFFLLLTVSACDNAEVTTGVFLRRLYIYYVQLNALGNSSV